VIQNVEDIFLFLNIVFLNCDVNINKQHHTFVSWNPKVHFYTQLTT